MAVWRIRAMNLSRRLQSVGLRSSIHAYRHVADGHRRRLAPRAVTGRVLSDGNASGAPRHLIATFRTASLPGRSTDRHDRSTVVAVRRCSGDVNVPRERYPAGRASRPVLR